MNRIRSFIQRFSGRWARLPRFRLIATVLFICLAVSAVASASAGITTLVSVASDGTQGNGGTGSPSLSADGRFVAFYSAASNLVPDDTNGTSDVFVHDRQTGITEIVSIASGSTQANASSSMPSISADGRFVAFQSWATNLIPGDTTICWNENETYGDIPCQDIFVHDRQTGMNQRASHAYDGGNRQNGSIDPALSADGRFVAFTSYANNLVPGGGNFTNSIYLYDLQTGTTELVSVNSDGETGNWRADYASLSADGRFVAFQSRANNLVPGDTNACFHQGWYDYGAGYCPDIFVHDRQTGLTERVSVASDGTQGDYYSDWPKISADGRFVTFDSVASNLVPNDNYCDYYGPEPCSDIFVHDRQTGLTERVSIASDGTPPDRASSGSSISADGRFVAFTSWATNLTASDTNDWYDVFVHDRETGITERVSVASNGTQGNYVSWSPGLSTDGRFVAFTSAASNLVSGDTNGAWDVFVRDRGSTATVEVTLDIKPGSFPNRINPRSNGVIPVALLTNGSFDATTADPATLRFGVTGQEAAPVHMALEDVDGDGDTDLLLHFRTRASGIQCGDTSAALTGETYGGLLIHGSDSIQTTGCH
jgi:Tol biopolymer transport system component